ncbi:MAG: FeoB-associated Cys-rich membrane protein [Clostridia bacterium]|nr:FeoB-associated Cys-rich membrane protein [Clostridia bacterium]
MDWIVQNIGSILVGAVLLLLIGVIVYMMRKDKKAGNSSCGSSCASCPMSGKCHEKNK